VWGKDTLLVNHISNTQTKRQLSAGDEKSIPDLKIIIIGHGQLDVYLVPLKSRNQFSPHNPSKNTRSVLEPWVKEAKCNKSL
jgi:hypothetical protein